MFGGQNSAKDMFGVIFSSVHFGRRLLCYSNFDFFYIDEKEETNLIARSSGSHF